jgi:hypothetical protein
MNSSLFYQSRNDLDNLRETLVKRLNEIKGVVRKAEQDRLDRKTRVEAFEYGSQITPNPGPVPKAIPIACRTINRLTSVTRYAQTDWTLSPNQAITLDIPTNKLRLSRNLSYLRTRIAQIRATSPTQRPRPITEPMSKTLDNYRFSRWRRQNESPHDRRASSQIESSR